MSNANIFSLVEEYLNICSRHQEIVRERELIIADFHYNTSIVLIEYLRQLPLSSLREQTNPSTSTPSTRVPAPNSARPTPPLSRRNRETNLYDSILNRRRSIYSTPPTTTRNRTSNNTYRRSTTTPSWSNYVRSGYNSSASSVFDQPPNTTRNRYSAFPSNSTTSSLPTQTSTSGTQTATSSLTQTSTSGTQTSTSSPTQTSTSGTQTSTSSPTQTPTPPSTQTPTLPSTQTPTSTTTDEHNQTSQPPVNLSEADTSPDTSNDPQTDYPLTFPPRETGNNDSLHINTDISAHNNLDEETLPSQVLVHSPPPNTEISNSDTTINIRNTRNSIMTRQVANTYASNRDSDLGITIADMGLGRRRTTNVRTFISSFESPVRIRPSRSQINNATSLIRLSDVTTDISGNTTQTRCPIDLIDFTEDDSIMRIDHCGHLFRESNLRIHFRNNTRCPLCRFDIRDHNNV